MSPSLAAAGVFSHKKYGDNYHALNLVAPGIGAQVEPGQFINVSCGPNRDFILRRPFSIFRVHEQGGAPSTIEIVFDLRGPGTRQLASLHIHDKVDIMGPLGVGFSLPRRKANCLLVGGGVGAAPLFFLADRLRRDGHRIDVVLGARNAELLLNPMDLRRMASVCNLTTEDGSAGASGRVTDVLAATMDQCGTEVVYACGPHPMLAAVAQICVEKKVFVQVAVEELMACGYGVCMTCVMPLRERRSKEANAGRSIVYARTCTEGPVFNGAQVIWSSGHEHVARDQSELSLGGGVVRTELQPDAGAGHGPPGN